MSNGFAVVSKSATEWAEDDEVDGVVIADDGVEQFLRRHQDELLHFLKGRLAQPQDAGDLAQETSARLLRYRSGHSDASLRLLMFRIARNLLKDHWRWSRLHAIEEPTDPVELVCASEEPSHEEQADGRQRLRRLEEVIVGLPDKCRTVFVLSRINGLSNAQVAQRCGISVKMVEKHLARAMADCRRQVGDPET